MSAGFPLTQRVIAYQPRATPWDIESKHRRVLKERRIAPDHYIDTQKEHHRTRTFQDEYRAFLKKYGIDYDERYVWD
ncbi:MAG TPA: hypothetical protein VK742_17875 [Candidatus Sulfotelmatobacter sp.]|jgi:hypothetical protein|nr:hypothetical protein [Candidatus Sulfotelmatobacter sp.]